MILPKDWGTMVKNNVVRNKWFSNIFKAESVNQTKIIVSIISKIYQIQDMRLFVSL